VAVGVRVVMKDCARTSVAFWVTDVPVPEPAAPD
jgi:hypothetical protein